MTVAMRTSASKRSSKYMWRSRISDASERSEIERMRDQMKMFFAWRIESCPVSISPRWVTNCIHSPMLILSASLSESRASSDAAEYSVYSVCSDEMCASSTSDVFSM